MRLRSLLCLLAAFLPASCFLWHRTLEHNLLVISVDSLRFDAISKSVGAARTPNMQRLAADGVAFAGCFSHSPVTLPSNVALFSSRLPHESGVLVNGQPIAKDVPLLAEWLAKHEWQTFASVGIATLWQPRPKPVKATPEADDTTAHRPITWRGLERGFRSFVTAPNELATAQEVNDGALPLLRSAQPDHPWFLFAQYSDPHEPYEAYATRELAAEVTFDGAKLDTIETCDTQWWEREIDLPPGRHLVAFRADAPFKLRRFDAASEMGDSIEPEFEKGKPMQSAKQFAIALDNTEDRTIHCKLSAWLHDSPAVQEARARYKLEVENVDRAVGTLIDELVQCGAYDQTCIVLTADHGEALGEHGATGHLANLFDEVLRVPLIIKLPKGEDEALAKLRKAQYTLVRQIDIVPTVLDVLDVRALPGTQGVSLLASCERELVAEIHSPDTPVPQFAMRDERYKLVYTPSQDRFEMYDLPGDTLEVENVFVLQGHLRAMWQSRLKVLAQNSPQPDDQNPIVKSAVRVRALGY